jgi:Virulence factor
VTRRERRRPAIITIWWRDIPAQVNGQAGVQREQAILPWRFQWAIECAAKKADLTDVHEFTKQWRRSEVPWDGNLDELAAGTQAAAASLDDAYDQGRLEVLVLSGGAELPVDVAPTRRQRVIVRGAPKAGL